LSYGPAASLRVQDHVTPFGFAGQRPALVKQGVGAGNGRDWRRRR